MLKKYAPSEIEKIIKLFQERYGNLEPFLRFGNAFQLLIAVILSAQCTDKRVNIITDSLFKKYFSPSDIAKVAVIDFEKEIKTCGMYHNKAKNIIASADILEKTYNNEVPRDFDALIGLPGVGRKSANVILGTFYNEPRFPVDTHVLRVSNRIGLASSKNPDKVENELTVIIPEDLWMNMHRWLIHHGRNYCTAKKPKCIECFINSYCFFYLNFKIL